MDTHPIILLAVFLFGSFIGSFLNVIIWRWPREKNINGRSECPHCHHQLSARDLIPVVSYLLAGGKCRYCKKRISWRYPLIEIVTGVLFVIAVIVVNPAANSLLIDWLSVAKYCFIYCVLLVVFVIDYEHYLILDKIVFPSLVIVVVWDFVLVWLTGDNYQPFVVDIILGAVAGFMPFYLLSKLSKGKWMGLGDAKLGLFLGAVFGFPQIWVSYFIAFLLGTVVSLPLLLAGKKELTSKLPFGTFLAVSACITMWFGYQITAWYLGLIGVV